MSLRHAVLGLLTQEPGSGYDLIKRFEISMAHVWPATQSQLYTELGKLTSDGLIEVTGHGARGRKDYATTPAGRAALREWLQEPVREVTRDAQMLQIFLLGEVPREEALHHLDALGDDARHRLEMLRTMDRTIPWDETARDTFSRMALDLGIRHLETLLTWTIEARERLGAH